MKNKLYEEMYAEYRRGFSLSEVGKMFGVTRQSVFGGFKCRGYALRKKKRLPYLSFNGDKFTLRKNGYYGKTYGDRKYMHVAVWEYYKGKIPARHHIHHKDGDTSNNVITNLEVIWCGEHTKLHAAKRKEIKAKGL